MLSLFPTLLVYQEYGPFLLRLTLGIIFLYWSYRRFKGTRNNRTVSLGLLDVVLGALLLIGLYTQLAALVAAIVFLVHLVIKIKNKSFLTDGVNYYFILFVISLSLLVMGPGKWAFDLPL